MKFLIETLRVAAPRRTPLMQPGGMWLVRSAMLDARAYGISSAVSALLRDLRH